MRISDWSSDVCSSDLGVDRVAEAVARDQPARALVHREAADGDRAVAAGAERRTEVEAEIGLSQLERVDLGRADRAAAVLQIAAAVEQLGPDADRAGVVFREHRGPPRKEAAAVPDRKHREAG